MLALEIRHNIALLCSHIKHSRITLIFDLSSFGVIFLRTNDLKMGTELKESDNELTKWMCSCAKYLRRMKMKTYTFV
jgi:hypothetical protein